MKLVVISTFGTYPELNNGPPIVAYTLLKYWDPKVDELHLFTGVRSNNKIPNEYSTFKHLHYNPIIRDWTSKNTEYSFNYFAKLLYKTPWKSASIFLKIVNINPDIVFYNGIPLDPLFLLPFLLKAKKFTQISRVSVYLPQEFGRKSNKTFLNKIIELIYNHILNIMNLIITQSEDMMKLISGNSRTKCKIIPNGTTILKKKLINNKKLLNVLFTGNVTKEKGIETLIESLLYLHPDFISSIELHLVGQCEDNYHKSMIQIIEKNSIKIPIKFIGEIKHDEIQSLYEEADIFIFPSFNEGMPNSLLEAMGAGLPIVASDIAPIRCLINDGYNGLLFHVGDANELASCLEKLIRSKELRNYLGKNSNDSAQEYSWELISNKYLETFDEYIK
jgi:glycosyltransferase involved in cell wall biosynthesis